MKLSPRAEEVRAVIATLNDPKLATEQTMAKAVIKRAAEIISMRTTYVVRHTMSGCEALYGPFGSEIDAEKFATTILPGGGYKVYRQHSPAKLMAKVTADEAWPGWEDFCERCGHADTIHTMTRDGRTGRGKCCLPDCDCPQHRAKGSSK